MSFAQNLKYIKEKENLTNYRLAKLFGCSQSSLINWLDNGVVPHPKTRQKIADHFGITLAELDGDELPVLPEKGAKKSTLDPKTEGVKKAPATEGEGYTELQKAAIQFVLSLPPEKLERFIKMGRAAFGEDQ
jgi:transcriptional regulator with XRE-family HTH domain